MSMGPVGESSSFLREIQVMLSETSVCVTLNAIFKTLYSEIDLL